MANYDKKGEYLFPLNKLLPSIVTLLAVAAGLTSIRFAIAGDWSKSVGFILLAFFMDGLDGKLARLLSVASDFGAYLDSIADFLNFGVAPALMIYFWSLHNCATFGWFAVLAYTICIAIRLARFNATLDDNSQVYNKGGGDSNNFFVGVPAPSAAVLVMTPVMLFLEFGNSWSENILLGYKFDNYAMTIYVIAVALLSVSKLPTISLKKMYIPKSLVYFTIVIVALFILLCITHPWIVFPIMSLFYVLSMPFVVIYFYRKRKLENDNK